MKQALKRVWNYLFIGNEPSEIPDDSVVCFVCDGFCNEDVFLNCTACDGDGYIKKENVELVRNRLFPENK